MPSKIRWTIKKNPRLSKSLKFLLGWGRLGAFPILLDLFFQPGKKINHRIFEASGIPWHYLKGAVLLGLFIKSPELFIKSHRTFLQNPSDHPKNPRLSKSLRFLLDWGRLVAFPLLMSPFPTREKTVNHRILATSGQFLFLVLPVSP